MNADARDNRRLPRGRKHSPRTVIPNGSLIEAYRKAQGWSREEFEWQSHLAVEQAAQDGRDDVRFLARYKSKKQKGRLAGIGTTTLTNVESGKRVYAFTLRIVAETLGVPVRALIADEHGARGESEPADSLMTDVSNEDFARLLQIDRAPKTAVELAMILRALLDRICP